MKQKSKIAVPEIAGFVFSPRKIDRAIYLCISADNTNHLPSSTITYDLSKRFPRWKSPGSITFRGTRATL